MAVVDLPARLSCTDWPALRAGLLTPDLLVNRFESDILKNALGLKEVLATMDRCGRLKSWNRCMYSDTRRTRRRRGIIKADRAEDEDCSCRSSHHVTGVFVC